MRVLEKAEVTKLVNNTTSEELAGWLNRHELGRTIYDKNEHIIGTALPLPTIESTISDRLEGSVVTRKLYDIITIEPSEVVLIEPCPGRELLYHNTFRKTKPTETFIFTGISDLPTYGAEILGIYNDVTVEYQKLITTGILTAQKTKKLAASRL